jgi:hypothetical protein
VNFNLFFTASLDWNLPNLSAHLTVWSIFFIDSLRIRDSIPRYWSEKNRHIYTNKCTLIVLQWKSSLFLLCHFIGICGYQGAYIYLLLYICFNC